MNTLLKSAASLFGSGLLVFAVIAIQFPASLPQSGVAMAASPATTLETIRGWKSPAYAVVVLHFTEAVQKVQPSVSDGILRFSIPNVTTSLPSYRKYRSFDGWLQLQSSNGGLEVALGLPEYYRSHRIFFLEKPHRLVIHIFETNRLMDIWGGRIENMPAFVLTFAYAVKKPSLLQEEGNIEFSISDVRTDLKPYRRYRTFDGWLALEAEGNDLTVRAGRSESEPQYRLEQLDYPPRLVLFLMEGEGIPESSSGDAKPDKIAGQPNPTKPDAVSDQQSALSKQPRNNVDDSGKGSENKETSASLVSLTDRQLSADKKTEGEDGWDDNGQRDRIRAGIYSRMGKVRESLGLYENLRHRFPENNDIRADHIEVLLNAGYRDAAERELDDFLLHDPDNIRALGLSARLYMEKRSYNRAFTVYERVINIGGGDPFLWSDYAFARKDAGNWMTALRYFRKIVEQDKDHVAAKKNIQSILRDHSPQGSLGIRSNEQNEGRTTFNTGFAGFHRPLTETVRIGVRGEKTAIHRENTPFADDVDKTMRRVDLRLNFDFHRNWRVNVTGGGFRGLGRGETTGVALEADVGSRASVGFAASWNEPWFDPVEAALIEGRTDRYAASVRWAAIHGWYVFGSFERRCYHTEPLSDYGDKDSWYASITKVLTRQPELSVTYSFFRGRFSYDQPDFEVVPMVIEETVHGMGLEFSHRISPVFSGRFSGGVRRDVSRSLNSWYLQPGLRMLFGSRLEVDADYEYSSESGTVDGGESKTWSIRGKMLF